MTELTAREQEIFNLVEDGYTNSEIADTLDIAPSTVKRTKSYIKAKGHVFTSSGASTEEEKEEVVLTYEDITAKVEKKEARKEQIEELIRDKFIEYLTAYIPRLTPVPFIGFENKLERTEEEIVLLLADFHGGEEVSNDQCDGEYNLEIMKNRIKQLYTSTMSIVHAQSKRYRKINIVALGDMISGNIHEELKQNTAVSVQVLEVSKAIAELIRNLSAYFEEVDFAGVVGNHGRLSKKPTAKDVHDNFDWLVYSHVEAYCSHLRNVKCDVTVNKNYYKTIQGKTFMFTHGDTVSGGGSWTAIERSSQRWNENYMKKYNKPLNYIVMGHFHKQACWERNFGEIIMVGTLKGGDEYAQNRLGYTSSPQQMILSVHPRRGRTFAYNIQF